MAKLKRVKPTKYSDKGKEVASIVHFGHDNATGNQLRTRTRHVFQTTSRIIRDYTPLVLRWLTRFNEPPASKISLCLSVKE
jgi:hypothetical protein